MAKPIPDGQDCFIPHLCCSPCSEAMDFYKRAFGAQECCRIMAPDGKRVMHGAMVVDGKPLFFVDDFAEYCGGNSATAQALGGTPVTIHRFVTDCDAAIQRAVDAGASVVMPAQDMFWGDRYGMVVDPYGHKWSIATHIKDMTTEETRQAMDEAFSQAQPAAQA